ncbi:MAG: reverse transcriptase family protein [Sedimenticola sp.]
MWIKIDHSALGIKNDIIAGFIYQPPESSRFFTADEAETLDIEITSMCIDHSNVYLFGDFNSHISDTNEFINIDNFLMESLEIEDAGVIEYFNKVDILPNYGLDINRVSKDKKTNNSGHRLIDVCKSNNLFILNGRCGDDKGIGEFTFRDTSIIDYAISSVDGLKHVQHFSIERLDALFSDGHSLLSTKLIFQMAKPRKVYKENTSHTSLRMPIWKESNKQSFVTNIDTDKVKNISCHLINLRSNLSNVTANDINQTTSGIADIFVHSANISLANDNPTRGNGNFTYRSNDKAWFGPNCKKAREKYLQTKNIFASQPSETNRLNMVQASKNYKKTMNKYIHVHKTSTQRKLRNLKSQKPKEFWKILNKMEKNKKADKVTIDDLYNHFKNVNINAEHEDDFNIDFHIDDDDEILNSSITDDEIRKCIIKMRNNKAPGSDNIINEYIKTTIDDMLPIYTNLFNLVLETGILPECWLEGISRPIYKGKGASEDPANYRPITLVSCFGKLFTSVLQIRLNNFLEYEEIMKENQAGFRKGYSTTDHVFVLHSLIEMLKQHKKKLFCCFVDFSKAFDSVWRVGLWQKLLQNNIHGKFFRVIHNMYQNIKSCVSINNEKSAFFVSNVGVRQGENLSPLLFALFLNDLEGYLEINNCRGVELNCQTPDIRIFLKLLVLLYADDTVIMADNEKDLQFNMDHFNDYCSNWKLNVNFSKTKVVIFGARKTGKFHFKLGGNSIDITENFKYLGIYFSQTRSFLKARQHIAQQARKAMHLLYKRIRYFQLPIDLQLQIFDHTILPIMLYGSEVWGFENSKLFENLHCSFLRTILKIRKSTPLYMLYAELGRYPIEIHIKSRMINYWMSLKTGKQSKLSILTYDTIVNDTNTYKWLSCIRNILQNVGRNDLWLETNIQFPEATKKSITRTLKDQYLQQWSASLQSSSKGKTYNLFKTENKFEPYLINLTTAKFLPIVRFRTSNHKLPIETGRWNNIDVANRKCILCTANNIGDEFHYLLECDFFNIERKKYVKKRFYHRPNILKFQELMQTNNINLLTNLSLFVSIIMNTFN